VAAVTGVPDFEHALELANQTDLAVTAGIISRSPSHIEQAAAMLKGANIYVNRAVTAALPGRRLSLGHGMPGDGPGAIGPDHLLGFVRPRIVTENTLRQGFAPAVEPDAGRRPSRAGATKTAAALPRRAARNRWSL
jgi:RHH-type proline utilization regulon transcriptional repressor/proline dehydrogenase/delta 1-pyrroline-5-carboxylate dehydrogenase